VVKGGEARQEQPALLGKTAGPGVEPTAVGASGNPSTVVNSLLAGCASSIKRRRPEGWIHQNQQRYPQAGLENLSSELQRRNWQR